MTHRRISEIESLQRREQEAAGEALKVLRRYVEGRAPLAALETAGARHKAALDTLTKRADELDEAKALGREPKSPISRALRLLVGGGRS